MKSNQSAVTRIRREQRKDHLRQLLLNATLLRRNGNPSHWVKKRHFSTKRCQGKSSSVGKVRRRGPLPVEIKKAKGKYGNGLFATRDIKKNNVVAYYHCKVFSYKSKTAFFENGAYSMNCYTSNGRLRRDVYLDLFPGSVVKPHRGIPHWGHIANEDLHANAFLKWGDEGGKKVQAGDTLRMPLVTRRAVRKGEEICWYYGPAYPRDYICEKPKNWEVRS